MEGLERALKKRQVPVQSGNSEIGSGHMRWAEGLTQKAQSRWAKPLARIIGRQSAASIKLYKMQRGRASVDSRALYDEDFVDNRDVTSSVCLPITLALRRSQLRQVIKALKQGGKDDGNGAARKILVKNFTPDGIQVVVTELMKKNIKTGPECLQTWKNFVSRVIKPTHISLKYHELGVQTLKRSRVPAPLRQAPELRIEDMAKAVHVQEPLAPG